MEKKLRLYDCQLIVREQQEKLEAMHVLARSYGLTLSLLVRRMVDDALSGKYRPSF